MNQKLIKCLPLILSLGLAACGGDKATEKKGGGPAQLQAATISTTVEADCGDGAVAVSDAKFDLTECQLGANHMGLLQEVGPFKVEADHARQSIRIKNASDEIAGEGTIAEDGTFTNVKLSIGNRFSNLEGCAVVLEGMANGRVTFTEDKKLATVELTTAFGYKPGAIETLAFSPEFALLGGPTDGKQDEPKTNPGQGQEGDKGKGEQPGQQDPGKGKGEQPGQQDPGKGKGEQPGQQDPGKGKGEQPGQQDPGKGKDEPKASPAPQEPGKGNQDDKGKEQPCEEKGKQDGGQGGQQGGQDGKCSTPVPSAPVGSCVQFNPCGFTSSTSLSCSR